jgi:hypothetical protein
MRSRERSRNAPRPFARCAFRGAYSHALVNHRTRRCLHRRVGGSDVRVSREPILEHFRGTLQEQRETKRRTSMSVHSQGGEGGNHGRAERCSMFRYHIVLVWIAYRIRERRGGNRSDRPSWLSKGILRTCRNCTTPTWTRERPVVIVAVRALVPVTCTFKTPHLLNR